MGFGRGLFGATVLAATIAAASACAMAPTSARTAHGSGTADGSGARRGKSTEPVAQRLYQVGEEKFAAGHPEDAVALWRHAITQLPQTERYDALRHRLILRLGFGQVVAYHHTGKLAHLFDGKRMLDRYLVTHQELFGETEAAKRERGEVYELLFEMESRIEDPPESVEAGTAVGLVEPEVPVADAAEVAEAAPTKSRRRQRRAKEDADGDHRTVVVDTARRPSVDDPEMKKELTRWNPTAGLVLTAPSAEPWLPARAYVRIDGLPRRLDDAERESGKARAPAVAAEIVRSVRPALRACYDGAFSRSPSESEYALATVEVEVGADGSVGGAVIASGIVGDAIGDACVLERLADARVATADASPMRLTIDLLFFFDKAVMMNDDSGRSARNKLDMMLDGLAKSTSARHRRRSTEVPSGLPGIER